MTIRVFVEPGTLRRGTEVELADDEAHYLQRVRRAAPGDAIVVLDGAGGVHRGRVVRLQTRGRPATIAIDEPLEVPPVPTRVLLLGHPEPRATLEALTAASEAGATTVVLVACANAHHAVPSRDRIAKTLRAAQRQCGRPTAPRVEGPLDLPAALGRPDPRPAFVAIVGEDDDPTSFPDRDAGATVLIGPEGGLTGTEVQLAADAGFVPLSLGPWILRTPTAAAAALGRLWRR